MGLDEVNAQVCASLFGILMTLVATESAAAVSIPLPRSRPAAADQPPGDQAQAAPSPAEPSPCRKALTDEIAIAPSIPAIHEGACGGDDLVRLEAVVVNESTRVPLKPAATLRCPMAAAVADWARTDVAPLLATLGSTLAEIDDAGSYDCRGRNGTPDGKLSEHGRANALDVRGFVLSDGRRISLPDREISRDLREKILNSVCARFTTVLGPSSDWYHEDHIHLDLAARRNGYRICQWDVLDPLPKVAPLMPLERPAEAPPRDATDATSSGQAE